ncbi:hypothetical protein QZH41_010116 [Actinostola sp. cb2023]|nr:hypothetical protein QZH41_010116 [Actinostola sp. cb2023]
MQLMLIVCLAKICLSQNVEYIISPYESDAQIAYIIKEGFADLAITEDSDLLVYGCGKVGLTIDTTTNVSELQNRGKKKNTPRFNKSQNINLFKVYIPFSKKG